MPTYYLDLENGNDSNDGLSYANRWKTFTSGATAARIAPGDTIRVMGSPAPTSLGINATWTGGGKASVINITSSTNATPIEVTTSSSHGYSTGDTVLIQNHSTNTNANGYYEITVTASNKFTLTGSTGNGIGSSGTVRNVNNCVVRLASPLTQTIASTGPRSAWTRLSAANGNPTVSTGSATKEHHFSDGFSVGVTFTTGAAFYQTVGPFDLSGYQQISFWFYLSSGTMVAANDLSLELCSDSFGGTTVHTVPIPLVSITGAWLCVTYDFGTNLNNNINSVAIKVNVDRGAMTFQVCNIIACKASSSPDSLTLSSLIGKNTSGETWYPIASIFGTRVIIDNAVDAYTGSINGYSGTTETVTTYKRETIKLPTLATSSSTVMNSITDSGTSGSLIAYEGGWDRTNMSTQNLDTVIDGRIFNGYAINASSQSYFSLNKFFLVRFNTGFFSSSSTNFTVSNYSGNGMQNGLAISGTATGIVLDSINSLSNNSNIGLNLNFTSTDSLRINTLSLVSNNSSYGIYAVSANGVYADTIGKVDNNQNMGILFPSNWVVNNITSLSYNWTYGAQFGGSNNIVYNIGSCNSNKIAGINFTASNNYVYNGSTASNSTSGLRQGAGGWNYCRNLTVNDSTEYTTSTDVYVSNCRIFSTNHDSTADNHKIFTPYGVISSESSVRYTASGISWKLQPTNTNRNIYYPLSLSLAKVACNANALVTVSARFRRDDANLTMRLVCKRSQLSGLTSDTVSSMTAAANNWELLTITFTPTEIGVVEITAEAYGGSTYTGYVDDISISQA